MAQSRRGVPYPLWRRVEEIRKQRGWSKVELARRAGEAGGLGHPLRRATYDNLATSSQVPQPWIVNALAAAVGIDLVEAHRLAKGLDDDAPTVPASIRASKRLSDRQKVLLLNLYDELVAANEDESGEPKLRIVDETG
jgi:transcriptional regulator with XRE-family HTH domain